MMAASSATIGFIRPVPITASDASRRARHPLADLPCARRSPSEHALYAPPGRNRGCRAFMLPSNGGHLGAERFCLPNLGGPTRRTLGT